MVTSTTKSLASARKTTVKHRRAPRSYNWLSAGCANKRQPLQEVVTVQKEKRQKSEPDAAVQCFTSLNVDCLTDYARAETSYLDLLSPEKAARSAMLRSRFADTILKAEEKQLDSSGHKYQPETLKKEKEKLQEKARIAAEGRATEAASRKKAETESKLQSEKARKAARLALEKVEKETIVETDSNLEVQKELESLCGYKPSVYLLKSTFYDPGVSVASAWPVHQNRFPLEQLGLFIKPDVDDGDEDL